MPVMMAGIDPTYSGLLFVINCSIGLITPPVGTVLNVVCGVAGIPMSTAVKGVLPFIGFHGSAHTVCHLPQALSPCQCRLSLVNPRRRK